MFINGKWREKLRLSPENQRLLVLIIPLIIEQTIRVFSTTIAMAFISKSEEAVFSGVSLALEFDMLINDFISAFAAGGTVVISRFLGGHDTKGACNAAKQLHILMAAASAFLAIVIVLLRNPLIHLFYGSIEPDIFKNTLVMLLFCGASAPLVGIYYSGAAAFRSTGDSRTPMIVNVSGNALYIAGTAVFTACMPLGAYGTGYALIFSRAAMAALMLLFQSRKSNPLPLFWRDNWKPDFDVVKQVLEIGVPCGVENTFFRLGRMVTVSYIAFSGSVHIVANAAANAVSNVNVIPGSAIVLAAPVTVGRSAGAGDVNGIKRKTVKLLALTSALHAVTCLISVAAREEIAKIYHLSAEAAPIFYILVTAYAAPCVLIWSCSFVLPSVLRALREAKYTLIVGAVSMLVCRIAIGYILSVALKWGVVGVWVSMFGDWVSRTAFFGIRFKKGKWSEKLPNISNSTPEPHD